MIRLSLSQYPVLFSFRTYYLGFNKSYTTDATSGAGTADPLMHDGSPQFITRFLVVFVLFNVVFFVLCVCVDHCIVCPPLSLLIRNLAISRHVFN